VCKTDLLAGLALTRHERSVIRKLRRPARRRAAADRDGRHARGLQRHRHGVAARPLHHRVLREALDPVTGDNVQLPPDRRLAAQLAAPTWKLRGDQILIESKDDIRARLGSSIDDADAVVLAWHKREIAVARRRPGPAVEIYKGPHGWMG